MSPGPRPPRRALPTDWIEEDAERIPSRAPHGKRRSDALRRDVERLRRLSGELVASGGEVQRGVVLAVSRGTCTVDLAGAAQSCPLHPLLAETQRSEIAAGDEVEVEARPNAAPLVIAVLPRRSVLSRPDPHAREVERVVVANVDLVVVVVSLRRPPLRTGLVDRYLVAVARGGAEALLAVNKVDLATSERAGDPELSALADYVALELPIVLCSATSGEGIDELRRHLGNRTAAFVGHSGVGKSSLLNALAPELELATGEVSATRPVGRHTTRQATLHRLAGGARVIDTPGIRELGLSRLAPHELVGYFTDFAPHAPQCRYSDCSHTHEPSCAVRRAVDMAEISPARYAAYRRILASLAADEP